MASKSPIKSKEWKESINIQRVPFGLIVYSYAEKESNLGIIKNSRILLMDTVKRVIGYYNQDQIPQIPILKVQYLPAMKKQVSIDVMQCTRVKNKSTIEIKMTNQSVQGKKIIDKWSFTFKNNKMTQDWMKQINDAKQNKLQQSNILNVFPIQTFMNSTINQSQKYYQPSQQNINNQSRLLPINQPQALGYNLIVSAVVDNNKLNNPISTTPVTISQIQSKRGQNNNQSSSQVKNWNIQFLNSNNPLDILMSFRQRAQTVTKTIIDELNLLEHQRKFTSHKKQNLEIFTVGSLIITVVLTTQSQKQYKALKNQFRNYDYIINATQNRNMIRVPLAAVFNYKGVTALIKGAIPKKAVQTPYSSIYRDLQDLQKITNIDKQVFRTNGVFYKFTSSKTTCIFVDQLKDYISLDLNASKQNCQFRKQFMQNQQQILPGGHVSGKKSDKNTQGFTQLDQASKKMRQYGINVIKCFQNMDLSVISTFQLTKQLHVNGVSLRCLGLLASQCDNPLIKKYLISQAASREAKKIIRNELQRQIRKVQGSNSRVSNIEPGNLLLLDVAFSLLNDIVSQNNRSESIWKTIIQHVKNQFNLTLSKQDLSVGYFLSSLFQKSGLTFNYNYFLKDRNYFKSPNNLKRQFVIGFKSEIDCYHIGFIQQYKRINSILNSDPSESGFQELIEILQLRISDMPKYCFEYHLDTRIKWYLGNFIAYGSQDYKQIGLYNDIQHEPPTLNSIKQSILAMKWLRKNPNDANSDTIFELSNQLISFWGGSSHPLLSDLFDFASTTHMQIGNYQQAVNLAKTSLQNCIKIYKPNSLAVGQKHYQLADIYFKMGKKQEALTNYQTSRQILQVNNKTNINQYGFISLKLALLYLSFSKNTEAAAKALQALNIFQTPPIQQQFALQTYQVLARAYQILDKQTQAFNLSSMCSKKLRLITNARVFQRMLKLTIFPYLINISSQNARDLLLIYQKMAKKANKSQARQFLVNQPSEHLALQFKNKIQKLNQILKQINNKDLIINYKGINSANESQAQYFLASLESIGVILGENYVMGVFIEVSE